MVCAGTEEECEVTAVELKKKKKMSTTTFESWTMVSVV